MEASRRFREEPYSEVVLVTPALARKWQATSPGNIRKMSAVGYAKDMLEGRWRLTHQGLAFDEFGMLSDGHTRLEAVIIANVAVRMMVTWGVRREDAVAIDRGRQRSVAHVARSVGLDWFDSKIQALGHRMYYGLLALPTPQERLSAEELVDFCTRHRDAIEFTRTIFATARRGIAQASVQAAVARAFYSVASATLTEFGDALYSGVVVGEQKRAAALLSRFLLSEIVRGGGAGRQVECYAKTERAIAAFVKGEPLQYLHATRSELFVLNDAINVSADRAS